MTCYTKTMRNFNKTLSERFGDFIYHNHLYIQLVLVISLLIGSVAWSFYRYNHGATVCYDGGVSIICEKKHK